MQEGVGRSSLFRHEVEQQQDVALEDAFNPQPEQGEPRLADAKPEAARGAGLHGWRLFQSLIAGPEVVPPASVRGAEHRFPLAVGLLGATTAPTGHGRGVQVRRKPSQDFDCTSHQRVEVEGQLAGQEEVVGNGHELESRAACAVDHPRVEASDAQRIRPRP